MKVAADTFFVTYMLRHFIKIALIQKRHQQHRNSICWQNAHFPDFVPIRPDSGCMEITLNTDTAMLHVPYMH